MCRWIIAAPAASQAWAVSTSSSRVVGSCGKSAFASSAPVGATVIRVLVAVLLGVLAMGHIMAGRADATCPALWETVPS